MLNVSLVAVPKHCIAANCDGIGGDRLQPLQPSIGCCDKKEVDKIHYGAEKQFEYRIVWEKFTVGIFHVKKFHVKIFSSSWIKSSYLLPYFFNGKCSI